MCEQRYDFMENFYISLNAVLPMFIMLFIGFAIRKLNILKESFLPQLNKLVFKVFFPFPYSTRRNWSVQLWDSTPISPFFGILIKVSCKFSPVHKAVLKFVLLQVAFSIFTTNGSGPKSVIDFAQEQFML